MKVLRQLITIIFIFNAAVSFSQLNVYKVDETQPAAGKNGVFYSLPQTAIRIDVTVEKTEHYKGPLSNFAESHLGLTDYIRNDHSTYRITGLSISDFAIPDPNHFYFVEIDEKLLREEKAYFLSLSESGYLMGTSGISSRKKMEEVVQQKEESAESSADMFKYFTGSNLYEKIDTIIRIVQVDTNMIRQVELDRSWQEKPDEEKAKEAVSQITRIREGIYNLLVGYQEVPYEKETMEFMHSSLKDMEREYVALFAGKTITKTLHYTFNHIPDPAEDNNLIPVFKFSEERGIAELNGAGGDKISIRIQPAGTTGRLQTQINARDKAGKDSHGFYYRIPEPAMVSIEIDEQVRAQEQILISQLGVVTYLPSFRTLIEYHPETGSIKNLMVE